MSSVIRHLPDKVMCLLQGIPAMKKRNVFIGHFVFLMLIASFVAYASTSKQESTGEYVDDSLITTKVKSPGWSLASTVDPKHESDDVATALCSGTVHGH
jgi:hypothetical protein